MNCGKCGQFSPIVLLENAPDGGDPWCWMCSALYRADSMEEAIGIIVDDARGRMQGAVDTARCMGLNTAHATSYVLFTQRAFEAWTCFCFWLSGMRYSYDFEEHRLTFTPPFDLKYIKISFSVDTSTGKVVVPGD